MKKGGWANRLWLYFAESDIDISLYNLSISGETTSGILTRFEMEAKTRNADVIIFQVGGNDAAKNNKNNFWVSPGDFQNNLNEILEKAKKITDKIIFIGFNNVNETKTLPVAWIDIYYANENIKRYNEITKSVCQKNSMPYLEIFGVLENKDLEDGLHPNNSGHQKIFEKIKNFLVDNQIINH